MSIIKVSTSIFSTIKTIEKALSKAKDNDEIRLASAIYKENITINENVTISSLDQEKTVIEGIVIVPKHTQVTFKHVTFHPTSHLQIEGEAIFENCVIDGHLTKAAFSVTHGQLQLINCTIQNSQDIGIAIFENSNVSVEHCVFYNNGKTHLLAEKASVVMEYSEFSHAQHAIWAKNGSIIESEQNHFHEQLGTQIIIQDAHLQDLSSTLYKGNGNGIYASKSASVSLYKTELKQHDLPQIWLQNSELTAHQTKVIDGQECGIMISEQSIVEIYDTVISNHKVANAQVIGESRCTFERTKITFGAGVGLQVKGDSIVNLTDCSISEHTLTQLYMLDRAIVSMNNCIITNGKQVGIIAEKASHCTVVNSKIHHHLNSGMTILDSEMVIIDSFIEHNNGNGILTIEAGIVNIEQCHFQYNGMPHIGGKNKANITINNSHFTQGKSLYATEQCKIHIDKSYFTNSKGVQIELNDMSTCTIQNSHITNGQTNAIKVQKDSSITIVSCHISEHLLPQVVINDSSLVMDECEVLDGSRNGFIIEHYSEANIKNTLISRHSYPQIWVDRDSVVELEGVQLLDSKESDLFVQNSSRLYANNCLIRNTQFQYTIQAINHSKIEFTNSYIESPYSDCYLQQNNSSISSSLDEVNE